MMYCLTEEEYNELKNESDVDDTAELEAIEELDSFMRLIAKSKIHSYQKPEELNREYVAIELQVDDLPERLLELVKLKQGR